MITDIYNDIKNVFENFFKTNRNSKNSKEFDCFIFYNTINQIGIKEKNNRGSKNLISKNIKNGEKSIFFLDASSLCFTSKKDNRIKQDKNLTNFSINVNGFTCVKKNNNGYFIEKGNLNDKIEVYYYDVDATKEFENQKINANFINSENEINFFPLINSNSIFTNLAYTPNEKIEFKKINNKILIKHSKNLEIINQEIIDNTENKTLYSICYEYMTKFNSHKYIIQYENSKKRIR